MSIKTYTFKTATSDVQQSESTCPASVCESVPQCSAPFQCLHLGYGLFSSSIPATWCRVVHSRVFSAPVCTSPVCLYLSHYMPALYKATKLQRRALKIHGRVWHFFYEILFLVYTAAISIAYRMFVSHRSRGREPRQDFASIKFLCCVLFAPPTKWRRLMPFVNKLGRRRPNYWLCTCCYVINSL